MENIRFDELTFTEPGVYTYTIKELTSSGYGWITDDRAYRITITVTANESGELVAVAEYPDGKPQFTNIFSCIPTAITLRAIKVLCGIPIYCQHRYNCCFLFGLFNKNNKRILTAKNFNGTIIFPKLLFTRPGIYKYTLRELTAPFCCWKTDDTVFSVEITVTLNTRGKLKAHTYFPNGEPIFTNEFVTRWYRRRRNCAKCGKCKKCDNCGRCMRY